MQQFPPVPHGKDDVRLYFDKETAAYTSQTKEKGHGTKDYSPRWPCFGFETEFSVWRLEHYGNDSAMRKIVRFVKRALK